MAPFPFQRMPGHVFAVNYNWTPPFVIIFQNPPVIGMIDGLRGFAFRMFSGNKQEGITVSLPTLPLWVISFSTMVFCRKGRGQRVGLSRVT